MAKLTLTDITSGYATTTTINANNAAIEEALENTLSRDGTSPNQMEADLDMNSNRIYNLPDAVSNTEPVTLSQAAEIVGLEVPLSTEAILSVFSQEDLGELLYPQTAAELAAGVTPTVYHRVPGDIRRYGAVSDGSTDCSAAVQAAIDQAQQATADKAVVYIPAAQQGWRMLTGVSSGPNFPFQIKGDSQYFSYLYSPNNITLLTLEDIQQSASTLLSDFQVIGPGVATSSLPGIAIRNCSNIVMERLYVALWEYGVQYDGGSTAPESSFLCSMYDCVVVGNGSINIDALRATNYLSVINCTFGAAPVGLRCYESTGLNIMGGTAESCTSRAIDLDTSVETEFSATITGVDFENSQCPLGIIRIGATAKVRGVTIISPLCVNAAVSEWVINPLNCHGLTVIGETGDTGLNSGDWVNSAGNLTNAVFINCDHAINAFQVINGTQTFLQSDMPSTWTGRSAEARVALTYSASVTPDAAKGNHFELIITNGSALTINAPTNAASGSPAEGQVITLQLFNTSGGAHGTVTMDAVFHTTAAIPAIATGFNRTFTFKMRLGVWYEVSRSAADVAN
jgi:hypothetical protein